MTYVHIKMHLPIFRFVRKLRKPCFHVNPSSRFFSHIQNPNLSTLGPLTCRLFARSVIRFRGPDTAKFLQGLLTNDIRKIIAGDNTIFSDLTTPNVPTCTHKPIYAAMLTPQGRFLYDLFLYKMPSGNMTLDRTGSGPGPDNGVDEGAIYADVDSGVLDEALDCFKKYRVRSKVEVDNLAEEYCCWQRFGGALSKNDPENQEPDADALGWGAGVDRSGASAAHGNNIGWQWFKDPRLDSLGFRGIFPSDTIPPLVEADKEVKEEHYLLWRIERGVAEGSIEIPKGEAIPLEYNLVGLNAISFDKGCYVGQELIARTHHCGVIRKRLLPVKFTDDNGQEVEQEVSPQSEVVDSISNKKVGMVTTALGGRGMGLFKLDSVFKESAYLTIKDKPDVKVRAVIPDWWPREWFHEQKQAAA